MFDLPWLDDAQLQVDRYFDKIMVQFVKELQGVREDGETAETQPSLSWWEEDAGGEVEDYAPQGQDRYPGQGR